MSSRPFYRVFVAVMLICLVTSMVPPAASLAAPSGTSNHATSAAPARMQPPTNPVIPRPVSAQSTALPASAITQLRQQYGSAHTLSSLDAAGLDAGSFSTSSVETYALPNSINLSNAGPAEATLVIPAGVIRDSVQIDLSLSAYTLYSTYAYIAFRPLGGTKWSDTEEVLSNPGTGSNGPPVVTTNVTQKPVSLGSSVPLTTPLELKLQCTGTKATCTWSNLRFFQDMPGWIAPPFLKPSDLYAARVTTQPVDGISPTPERDAFLALRIREAGGGPKYSDNKIYQSASFTLPLLTASDVLEIIPICGRL